MGLPAVTPLLKQLIQFKKEGRTLLHMSLFIIVSLSETLKPTLPFMNVNAGGQKDSWCTLAAKLGKFAPDLDVFQHHQWIIQWFPD